MTTPPDAGNASTLTMPLDHLVLEPALQARVDLDEQTVDEYAAAMKAGASFPPVDVVRVDGQLLLVDGWHRHAAAKQAGWFDIQVRITEGTRRDALAAAINANSTHGLRRSDADKRKAVRIALQDAEWCTESNRGLADLVGVSHAFVGERRRHYGVQRGEVLTDERILRVDGDLPAGEWSELAEQAWSPGGVRGIFEARDLPGILQAAPIHRKDHPAELRAAELRLEELAEDAWPWPEDATEADRAERVAGLDDLQEIAAALAAEDCPHRQALYEAWAWATLAPELESWALRSNGLSAVEGRPALEQIVRDRLAELAAEAEEPSAWARARAVTDIAPGDRDEAIEALPAGALHHLELGELTSAERALARQRYEDLGQTTQDCTWPGCGGWARPRTWGGLRCWVCERQPEEAEEQLELAFQAAATALADGGRLQVGEVRVDRSGVAVLEAVSSAGGDWLDLAPPKIAAAVQAYRGA